MSKPTKEEIRAWMLKRQVERKPPPAPADVRRQLGWNLVKSAECAR